MLWLWLAAAHADDPYAWLEDLESPRALAWVDEQNDRTQANFEAMPQFAELEAALANVFGSPEQLPYAQVRGRYLYDLQRDAAHPRGLWRRTSLRDYARPTPAWEPVLDVDALAATEGVSWSWNGATCLPPDGRHCMIELSRGGSDAAVFREFDTRTRQFVVDGFSVPEAKTSVSWIDADTLWVSTGTTDAGYGRELRRWRRGTPLATAELVFAAEPTDVLAYAVHDPTAGFTRDLLVVANTFFTQEVRILGQDGALTPLDVPADAGVQVFRDRLYLALDTGWLGHPAGALLQTDLAAFLAGGRDFERLFTPTPGTSLSAFTPTRHGVALTVVDHARSRVTFLREDGTAAALPALPDGASASAWAADPDRNDDLWISVDDFLAPAALLYARPGRAAALAEKRLPAQFDATGLTVRQYEATSADGTKIPYFQVSKAELPTDGSSPTWLYAYGGFGVSETPLYFPEVGVGWLARGGTYVVANIRGGGEFGPEWHTAAQREHRDRCFQDVAAVADDLARRGVADAAHLGFQGESNGGLLAGNLLTHYPERFGAIVMHVPLLDLEHYTHWLAGSAWIAEYGDPAVPEDWAWLQAYSPYHNVRADAVYPPVLLMTTTRDDRVHPAHARKMAARLLEQGHEAWFYEDTEGGHAGASDAASQAHFWALTLTFLWDALQ